MDKKVSILTRGSIFTANCEITVELRLEPILREIIQAIRYFWDVLDVFEKVNE